ncbi:MAG: hypothetical protein ACYSUK_00225 [Planctomycetota bacterium]|jgi:hypothetical protein
MSDVPLEMHDEIVNARDAAIAHLQAEIERLQADNEHLRTKLDDIKNATKASMDETCDLSERHCTCVPLLRREIKHLRVALNNWVTLPVGSHHSCDCPKCVKLVDIVLEESGLYEDNDE